MNDRSANWIRIRSDSPLTPENRGGPWVEGEPRPGLALPRRWRQGHSVDTRARGLERALEFELRPVPAPGVGRQRLPKRRCWARYYWGGGELSVPRDASHGPLPGSTSHFTALQCRRQFFLDFARCRLPVIVGVDGNPVALPYAPRDSRGIRIRIWQRLYDKYVVMLTHARRKKQTCVGDIDDASNGGEGGIRTRERR